MKFFINWAQIARYINYANIIRVFFAHNNTQLLKYSAIIYTILFAVSAHGTHLLAKSKSDLFGKFHSHQYAGAGEV